MLERTLEGLIRFSRAGLFIGTFLTGTLVHAQACGTLDTGMDCVANGANKNISAFTVCAKITNAHASGKAIMIPLKTSGEWSSFRSNLPSGVTSGSCGCTPGSQTFAGDGTFTVPASCVQITIKAWGGGGAGTAAGNAGTGGTGGGGGYATRTIATTAGSTFAVKIGMPGTAAASGCTGLGGAGGYAGGNSNGNPGAGSGVGGTGGANVGTSGGPGGAGKYGGGAGSFGAGAQGAGGGGATVVTRNSDTIEIAIAGGGGGAGGGGTGSIGGAGGPGCSVAGGVGSGSSGGTTSTGGGGGGAAVSGATPSCASQIGTAGKVIIEYQ
jgi:hypothetical protein